MGHETRAERETPASEPVTPRPEPISAARATAPGGIGDAGLIVARATVSAPALPGRNDTRVQRSTAIPTITPELRRPPPSELVIRRKGGDRKVDSKSALTGLKTIPIIQTELAKQTAQGPTLEQRVATELKLFDAHLRRRSKAGEVINEAIRIATVVDATAGALAMSIGDPTLKGRIASEVSVAYAAELKAALGKPTDNGGRVTRTDRAIEIATAITSDDPLMLFMTGKVQKEDAAWRIREMADRGKLFAHEMFNILKDRFTMQMGSLTENQVTAGERKKDTITTVNATGAAVTGNASFELRDLIGELSLSTWNDVVEDYVRTKKGARDKLPAWSGDALSMKAAAAAKLGALETAVSDPTLARVSLGASDLAAEQLKSGADLTAKQSEHFHRLRGEETAAAADYEGMQKSPRAYCIDKLKTRYQIDATKAALAVDAVVSALLTVPLTLTNDLNSLFADRADGAAEPKYGSVYKSEPARMQQQVDIGATIGKPGHDAKAMAMGSPDPTFTTSRGANYMRWRRDKDERETGYHGLSADELPAFGAMNPNFHHTKGGNANMAEWDRNVQKYIGIDYGKNYYGDVHFLLRDEVRPRSTFIARGMVSVPGRRIERTDMCFLLADMIRLSMWDYVDAMIADYRNVGKVVLTNMDAEVHIYGTMDLATDVAAMYLQPAAHAATVGAPARAKAFAQANNIVVHDIGQRPVGYEVHARQGKQGGIDLTGAF